MKKAYLLAFMLVFVFAVPYQSEALQEVSEPGKKWEYGVNIGYKNFKESGVKDSVFAGFRMQRRVVYPMLLGVGVEGAMIGDVVYGELNVPLSVRTTAGPVKADFLLRPGVAYAENSKTDVKKVIGVGTAGIEIKKFVSKGVAVGVGVYYSATTYSKLNSFSVGLAVSF